MTKAIQRVITCAYCGERMGTVYITTAIGVALLENGMCKSCEDKEQ